MVSFLDLPREIRDAIYEFALVSPTGQIVPQIQKSISTSRFKSSARKPSSKRRSNLVLTFHPSDPTTRSEHPLAIQPTSPPLAILLSAVHPQIYIETSQLFWSKNTLVFYSPTIALTVLKHMGQVSSRLIKRVYLHTNPAESCDRLLGKALSMLASRARSGQLRELGLIVHRDIRQFCSCGRKGIGCRGICQHSTSVEIEIWMRGLEIILGKNRDVTWKGAKRWIHVKGPPLMEAWGVYLAADWKAQLIDGPSPEEFNAVAFPSEGQIIV